ncbi:LysR family transcriptional regulator [Pseudomonas aeruginosa]|uniref:LysR family transcriptional regulator n=2 Tax=Pseudomonadota TaxID=1224 RepID=UPI00045A4796|nr:LysR family transcriptional regulator [Bordetella hinzii]EIU1680547.1 LysR family transcriptional regulator [Pseudomonas aeruginosa]KCB46921.1 LysR substrate-binding domain protein [Bordetella hinzii 1277]MDN7437177.1 LysR family transcriptional regulator [Burkholderia multivorans]
MDRLLSMAVFVSAVEEGSLVSAARRFGLSPSMAGKHVSAIEEQLKVRLLQRSTRKLTLTDVGRSYYTRCKRLLEEYEDANREAQDAQQSVRGMLRVAAPTTFGALHLGRVVSNYLAEYPDVSIETTLSDRYVDLLADGIDIAIRIGRLQDSDLVARRLASCRMMFCAAPSFLARHGEPKTVEQLRQAPRLAFSQAVSAGDWSVTDANGQTHHIDGAIRLAANNMQMLLAAALTGAGVVYGPSFVFEQSIASGALRVLLADHKTTDLAIHAIYPSKRHVSLKVRRFIEHLSMSFGDTQPWDLMHRSTTA